jgi:hypothetical protein
MEPIIFLAYVGEYKTKSSEKGLAADLASEVRISVISWHARGPVVVGTTQEGAGTIRRERHRRAPSRCPCGRAMGHLSC